MENLERSKSDMRGGVRHRSELARGPGNRAVPTFRFLNVSADIEDALAGFLAMAAAKERLVEKTELRRIENWCDMLCRFRSQNGNPG